MAGAKGDIFTTGNLEVQINYNAKAGRSKYTAHYLNPGLRGDF